jgi:hypothetical protein
VVVPWSRSGRWEFVDAAIPVELYPLEPGFLDAFDQAMTLALLRYGRERSPTSSARGCG